MSDRDLLEAAARAAGYNVEPYTWSAGTEFEHHGFRYNSEAECQSEYEWNPLEDDGDALRLAVRLRMVVSLAYCTCCAVVDWADNEDENEVMVRFGEDFPDREAPDALAATRRAIVRAAAALTQPEGGA